MGACVWCGLLRVVCGMGVYEVGQGSISVCIGQNGQGYVSVWVFDLGLVMLCF